ncbi:MAG: thiamine-phosphate kinase [Promethearchaeota archaeon]
MKKDIPICNFSETELIKIIEELIKKKTNKDVIRDDCYYYSLKDLLETKIASEFTVVFNSDMLVSTTDIPKQMSYYHSGRKAVLMNISDLIVKGVEPIGIIISLGLPVNIKLKEFRELLNGIIDYTIKYDLEYIGGDLNETKELIINPTIFGFQEKKNIIYREGVKKGDYIISNGKFGLTGVGFNILLQRKGDLADYDDYKKSILSVLEPFDIGKEGLILANYNLAHAGIDSSDGLAKCLSELRIANPEVGFEIEFDNNLIHEEALKYSKKYDIPLEELVFNGGEEFIHLFLVNPENFKIAKEKIYEAGGKIFKIGRVTSNKKLMVRINEEVKELNYTGFNHFNKGK